MGCEGATGSLPASAGSVVTLADEPQSGTRLPVPPGNVERDAVLSAKVSNLRRLTVANHFGDRLMAAIEEKGVAACVGFDPLADRLPREIADKFHLTADANTSAVADAFFEYGRTVIELIAPHIPVIKINIAFFERYYADGVIAYLKLVKQAKEAGLVVIGDVKRADIGHSTTQYAHAQLGNVEFPELEGLAAPDAVTVNPYFGYDAIKPFVEIARLQGKGMFVLVQTSNPSAVEVQGLLLEDGSKLCERVGGVVQGWASGEGLIGASGYSSIGAVVSPRDLESTVRIRQAMPNCVFLVPGFGAQGRTADEVAKCFKPDGTGALITSSRGVIYAYQDEKRRAACGDNWQRCVEQGCLELVEAIRGVMPGR